MVRLAKLVGIDEQLQPALQLAPSEYGDGLVETGDRRLRADGNGIDQTQQVVRKLGFLTEDFLDFACIGVLDDEAEQLEQFESCRIGIDRNACPRWSRTGWRAVEPLRHGPVKLLVRGDIAGSQLESVLMGVDQVDQRYAIAGMVDIEDEVVEARDREVLENAAVGDRQRQVRAILAQLLAGGITPCRPQFLPAKASIAWSRPSF